MASSENVAAIDPWMLRPTVTDSWLAEYFSRDADNTITKALHNSLSNVNHDAYFLINPDASASASASAAATPTVSSLSGSDHDSAPKRRPPPTGKISKRKSRASKRSQTTFITADPANFRQMVQQVTGVRIGAAPIAPPLLKPEPHRPPGRFTPAAGFLPTPTLDTSAFLLEHQQVGPNSAAAGPGAGLSGPGPLPFSPSLDAAASFAAADFDIFSSFPTLESWKVL
ncbi:hypothetical protein Fmac_029565 [Flemingia macrophylla]|uniref:VQ domain-containing protein n=1 Tax=Flemingia macrophylla TaxID=520843 RepID=A0ABD1LAW2_9FABA